MSDTKNEAVKVAELKDRHEAELRSLVANKLEELRKVRFKHALGQLRETHVLKGLRHDIAKINTVLTQRKAQVEERT
jgi:large subunit ribosomal protein L29